MTAVPMPPTAFIDVSKHAAQLLGFIDRGTTTVRVEYVGPAQLDGSDDRLLEATLRQDEPAPVPGAVKLAAATRIVPLAMTVPSHARIASTGSIGRSLSDADASPNGDDTVQILNGRGLY